MVEVLGAQRVDRFLNELGWQHDKVAEGVVRARYTGHFGEVKVILQIGEGGLHMAINPILAKPQAGWSRSVFRLVEMLNRETHLIQVGLDRDGDIFVKVDVPKGDIEFEQFVYVIFNLCQVSEQLTVPVLQAQAYDTFAARA